MTEIFLYENIYTLCNLIEEKIFAKADELLSFFLNDMNHFLPLTCNIHLSTVAMGKSIKMFRATRKN